MVFKLKNEFDSAWDHSLLSKLFDSNTITNILKIPFIPSGSQDTLTWVHDVSLVLRELLVEGEIGIMEKKWDKIRFEVVW